MSKIKTALVYLICGFILTYQFIILRVMGIVTHRITLGISDHSWGIMTAIGAVLEIIGLCYINDSVREEIGFRQQKKRDLEEINTLAQSIEQSADGIIIFGLDGIVQYVNRSYEFISGLPRNQLLGMDVIPLQFKDVSSHMAISFKEAIQTGNTWRNRVPLSFKSGAPKMIEITVSPITDLEGRVCRFLASCQDITHDLEMEQNIAQMQKLESIGTLAGGIAHDFNNILSAIIGFTELAMEEIKDQPVASKFLQEVLQSANRSKDVIKQLIAFTRKEDSTAIATSLQTYVKEATKLLTAIIPKNITVHETLCKCNDQIMAVPGQIHQIILNLGTNAAHSMKATGGHIEIEVKDVTLQGSLSREFPELTGQNYYLLRFSDTGSGIPREIIERIFDPYFTTKPATEGSGLGLSIVHNIVRAHEGAIRVESKANEGTTFIIMLPRVQAMANAPEILVDTTPLKGTEKILFVDDEDYLVNIACQYLHKQGYKVTGFADSEKAWADFASHPEHYDLVITDTTMPGLTGIDLSKRIMESRPDVPIILITGYSSLESSEEIKELGVSNFLVKPYKNRDLAELIRETIDKEPLISTEN